MFLYGEIEVEVKAKSNVKRRGQIIRPIIELEVRNKDGKLIEKRRIRSHSFTMNFFNLLWGSLNCPANPGGPYNELTLTDTGGTSRSIYGCASYNAYTVVNALGLASPSGNSTYGLVVGSGTQTPTIDDYKLETPIVNGTEAGQLEYGATTVNSPSCSSNICTITIVRTFTNGTSNAINVNEIGLVVGWHGWNASNVKNTYYFLVAHDVLSSSVSIPAGSTLTIRYILEFTI